MQPVPGLDPNPRSQRVVAGVQVQGRSEFRIILGLLIVGFGVLLTLAHNGYPTADWILAHFYFPGALTAVGLYRVFTADSGMGKGVGGLLTVLGLWWLASDAYGFRFNIWHWWPLGIVALGVLTIMKAMRPEDPAPPVPSSPSVGDGSTAEPGAAAPGSTMADAGPVSAFAFWSGVHRRVSAAFKRANLAAFMGGIELDLRPAVTAGGQAVIEVFVVMGGLEITVPPDWTVANEALVVMGGIDDRSTGSAGATQTVIIRGFILMGGVEIKT